MERPPLKLTLSFPATANQSPLQNPPGQTQPEPPANSPDVRTPEASEPHIRAVPPVASAEKTGDHNGGLTAAKPERVRVGRKPEYKVGYKKPPQETQWQPGESGNKKGRKSGSRSFKTELRDVLEQRVTINDKGRSKKITVRQAILMRLLQKAMGGDLGAMEKLLRLATMHLPDATDQDDGATAAADKALLEEIEAELLRRLVARGDDDPDT